MDSITSREVEIGKIARSADRVAALQKHLKEIVQGSAFKGSLRSARFLTYVVEQAIAGNFDLLKERMIGSELFQRSPSYDTGEDAIVRVTASDVRKRLLQHYDRYGSAAEIHISLPLGSYIPGLVWDHSFGTDALDVRETRQDPLRPPPFSPTDQDSALVSSGGEEPAISASNAVDLATSRSNRRFTRRLLLVAVSIVILNLSLLGALWYRFSRAETPRVLSIPWSALFNSPNATHLITGDVDIVRIQRLIGTRISLSQYANRSYIPQNSALSPEDKSYLMQGDKSATIDTQITENIAELVGAASRKINVEGARNIRFSDLKTDDNFIFLGSPFSDPWFSVFNDQLDFQFIATGQGGLGPEAIRNIHPRPNEESVYASSANGGATGESFAIVALVGNPGQYGQILLLAGVSGEGTQAAGRLVTDLPRLSLALRNCGISSPGPLKHFEMLLRVNLMAGSPSEYDVVACHILAAPPIQVP